MPWSENTQALLDLAAERPDGITAAEAADWIGLTPNKASNILKRLVRFRHLAHVPGAGTVKMRYCLPQHEAQVREAQQAAIDIWRNPPVSEPSTPYVGEIVPPRRPIEIGQVPRFFSAMTPGSYLRTGSAIERAYAEREGA